MENGPYQIKANEQAISGPHKTLEQALAALRSLTTDAIHARCVVQIVDREGVTVHRVEPAQSGWQARDVGISNAVLQRELGYDPEEEQ